MNSRFIVWVCIMRGKGRCREKGGDQVLKRFQAEVESRGLHNVMVNPTGCSDRHEYGPAVALDPDNVWYCKVTPDNASELIDEHIMNGRVVSRLLCPI